METMQRHDIFFFYKCLFLTILYLYKAILSKGMKNLNEINAPGTKGQGYFEVKKKAIVFQAPRYYFRKTCVSVHFQ